MKEGTKVTEWIQRENVSDRERQRATESDREGEVERWREWQTQE